MAVEPYQSVIRKRCNIAHHAHGIFLNLQHPVQLKQADQGDQRCNTIQQCSALSYYYNSKNDENNTTYQPFCKHPVPSFYACLTPP